MEKFFILIIKKISLSFLLISCYCCDPFSEIYKEFKDEEKKELGLDAKISLKGEFDTSKIKLFGEGYWGKTFKLDDNTCLKIIKKPIIEGTTTHEGNTKETEKEGEEIPASEYNIIAQKEEYSISEFLQESPINNCQKILKTFENDKYYFILSELCKGPTLESYINKTGYKETTKILKDFKGIVIGVKDLHEKKIAHMDLKADNVMFLEEGCNTLQIIDFGTGVSLNCENKEIKGSIRNFSYNMAQSLANGKNGYNAEKYDIWCLGLILYHMYFGEELFPKYNFANILNAGLSFWSKKKYIKNVFEDRKNFDIKKDSKVKNLDTKNIIYTLLTNILTKEDTDRLDLDGIIKEIEKVIPL